MTTTPEPTDKLDAATTVAVSGPADDSISSPERIVRPRVIRPDGPARAGCGESRKSGSSGGRTQQRVRPTQPLRARRHRGCIRAKGGADVSSIPANADRWSGRHARLGVWCQTPLPETRENGSQIRGGESRPAPLRRTSATDLVPENADFGRAGRDAAKNTRPLGEALCGRPGAAALARLEREPGVDAGGSTGGAPTGLLHSRP